MICSHLSLSIQLSNIDWALYDASNNERIAHGPPEPYNYEDLTTYQGNLCLPFGDYYIKWMDMSADGICCDFGMGSWTGKKKKLCFVVLVISLCIQDMYLTSPVIFLYLS